MSLLYRGAIVALVHCVIVLSLAGKYAMDRERLPRVWVKTAPFDPNLPIRGRYVRLRVAVEVAGQVPGSPGTTWTPARLSTADGRLVATPQPEQPGGVAITTAAAMGGPTWVIAEPVAFFIPEHVPDPSIRRPGEELWVEVSVPTRGNVRPLRLGVRKDGALSPLPLR